MDEIDKDTFELEDEICKMKLKGDEITMFLFNEVIKTRREIEKLERKLKKPEF